MGIRIHDFRHQQYLSHLACSRILLCPYFYEKEKGGKAERKERSKKGEGKARKEEKKERREKGRKGKEGGRKERRKHSFNVLCSVLLLSQ